MLVTVLRNSKATGTCTTKSLKRFEKKINDLNHFGGSDMLSINIFYRYMYVLIHMVLYLFHVTPRIFCFREIENFSVLTTIKEEKYKFYFWVCAGGGGGGGGGEGGGGGLYHTIIKNLKA